MTIQGYGAEAIRAAEAGPLAAGVPLMRHAAYAVAREAASVLQHPADRRRGALVLVGGGNNGGDGLHAAADLMLRGISTTVLRTRRNVHPGGLERAARAGVRIIDLSDGTTDPHLWHPVAARARVWIDALAGIGVRGGLRDPAAEIIAALTAMRSRRHTVIAVDTPSGVAADTGRLDGPVLTADTTVTFGAAKAGTLLPPAALHVGRLRVIDLGLREDLAAVTPRVRRLEGHDLADLWPVPQAEDHKYSRGVVGVVAGSATYPGAGLLTTAAARATGAGMVRYLGPQAVADRVVAAYPDVVSAGGRVQALVVGPGLSGRDEAADAHRAIEAAIESAGAHPMRLVWDAGALSLLPEHGELLRTHPSVLTPHAGELATLLHAYGERTERRDIEADPAAWAATAARLTGAHVLLKGPVTLVASPGGGCYSQCDGTAWMATAGSGDVLAGLLGALAATADHDLGLLAAVAAAVHGRAGRSASAGGPIAATDIVRALPGTVRALLQGHGTATHRP